MHTDILGFLGCKAALENSFLLMFLETLLVSSLIKYGCH